MDPLLTYTEIYGIIAFAQSSATSQFNQLESQLAAAQDSFAEHITENYSQTHGGFSTQATQYTDQIGTIVSTTAIPLVASDGNTYYAPAIVF
jgi:hypothetical protein